MFGIRCPRCGKVFKTKRSVLQVKVKCLSCDALFVGSSEIFPDEGTSGAPGAGRDSTELPEGLPARRSYRSKPPPERSTTPWRVFVVIFGVLAIALTIVGISYYHKHPKVEIRDREGRTLSQTRRPLEELQSRETQQQDTEDPMEVTPPKQQAPVTHPPLPKTEPNILIDKIHIVEGTTPDTGHLVGVVHNARKDTVTTLKVRMTVLTVEGKRLRVQPVECRYIPPGGSLRFSKEYGGLRREEIQDVDWSVTDVQTEKNLICWEIKPGRSRRTVTDGSVNVEGNVGNSTGRTVWNVKVYCDFFTDENVHVHRAEGALLGESFLRPGATGTFKLSFDAEAVGYPAQVVTSYTLRAVGRR